jgi:uncharacterized membrane protein YbhN (UPF0104 family)
MNKPQKYFPYIAGALSIILFYRLCANYDFSPLFNLAGWFIVALTFIPLLAMAMWIYNTKLLFDALAISVSYKRLCFILSASLVGAYIGSGATGVLSKIYLYKKFLGVSYISALAVSSLELFLLYLVRMILAFIGIVVLFGYNIFMLIFVFFGCGSAIMIVIHREYVSRLLLRKHRKAYSFLANIMETLRGAHKGRIATFLLLCVITSFIYTLSLCLILDHYGFPLNIFLLVCINALSFVVGVASMIPMGLGVRDVTILGLLMSLGIPKDIAISTALLYRIFNTAVPYLLSLFVSNVLFKNFIAENET